MKTNFRKTLAVLLAVLMISSVFSVTVSAAYTAQILAGSNEGVVLKETLKDGTPITEDMFALVTNSSNKVTLPSEAFFEREDYVQDGWTKSANGGGTVLKFGSTQTVRNNTTKFYPHWDQLIFTFSFAPGNYYDETDPNNFADASMTEVKVLKMKTDGTSAQKIILPGAMFTRNGYVQTGWSTSKTNNGSGTALEFGSVYEKKITKDVELYPFWEPVGYKLRFEGGAYGVGEAKEFAVSHDEKFSTPGEIFTREDYTQIGWSTIEDSEIVEVELGGRTPGITGDTTYYPVWRKNIYSASVTPADIKFGTWCIAYKPIASQEIVITNNGNVTLEYTLPTSTNYEYELQSGSSLSVEPGKSITISIKPVQNLAIGNYAEDLVFACNKTDANVVVKVSFKVVDHSFGNYTSDNNATYTEDGTKSADCLNKCGAKDVIADVGSVKVYSSDNNTALGISDSYVYHRTVRFTAYGSGMDDAEGVVGKRFVPVSWYVNDDFNGTFEDGDYDVAFTHTVFGKYTLTINYVEEEFNAETGEWVATGETDEKTFEYTVGTTAEEEQEIVRPNTILSIIFGLFAELFKLLGFGG